MKRREIPGDAQERQGEIDVKYIFDGGDVTDASDIN
jgi:hypothetical protein